MAVEYVTCTHCKSRHLVGERDYPTEQGEPSGTTTCPECSCSTLRDDFKYRRVADITITITPTGYTKVYHLNLGKKEYEPTVA
jgi:hypothetical protein